MILNSIWKYKDEQERVQKKTFTNWINSYLIKGQSALKIHSLYDDIKDGIKLLELLEILSNEKLVKEIRSFMQRVHCLSNVRTALEFLEKKRVKLVNINASDIVDGKPSIVLGLIWTIILHFQIEGQNDVLTSVLGNSESTSNPSTKKALLAWTANVVVDYGIEIRDFGPSWRDGKAFNAMVHNVDPALVDLDHILKLDNRVKLENAFYIAEKHLGIPRLLDPEDVDVDKPDEKSIMTYLAQFLQAYPEVGQRKPEKHHHKSVGQCLPSQGHHHHHRYLEHVNKKTHASHLCDSQETHDVYILHDHCSESVVSPCAGQHHQHHHHSPKMMHSNAFDHSTPLQQSRDWSGCGSFPRHKNLSALSSLSRSSSDAANSSPYRNKLQTPDPDQRNRSFNTSSSPQSPLNNRSSHLSLSSASPSSRRRDEWLRASPGEGNSSALLTRRVSPSRFSLSRSQEMEEAKLTADKERHLLEKLKHFIADSQPKLPNFDTKVSDLNTEYKVYLDLFRKFDAQRPGYEELHHRRTSNSLRSLRSQDIEPVERDWNQLTNQLSKWRHRLDRSLPGDKLNRLGAWLSKAEIHLYDECKRTPAGSDAEVAKLLENRLNYHRGLFSERDQTQYLLNSVTRSGVAVGVSSDVLRSLEERFVQIERDEPACLTRLELEEVRFRVRNSLAETEGKLDYWGKHFSDQSTVRRILDDYVQFVETNKLLDKVNKALAEYNEKSSNFANWDSLHLGLTSQELKLRVSEAKSLHEKWSTLSKEVIYMQPLLEDILKNWSTYQQLYSWLHDWLVDVEKMVSNSDAISKKDAFIKDRETWTNRLRELNEAGQFLIDNCSSSESVTLKTKLLTINRRWKDLQEDLDRLGENRRIEQDRDLFSTNIDEFTKWLSAAESLTSTGPMQCEGKVLREYFHRLSPFVAELEERQMELDSLNKVGTKLVSQVSGDIGTHILGELKSVSRRFEKVYHQLSDMNHVFPCVIEALGPMEEKMAQLDTFLTEGQEVLNQVGSSSIQKPLKNYFSQLGHYKAHLTNMTREVDVLVQQHQHSAQFISYISLQDSLKHYEMRLRELSSHFTKLSDSTETCLAKFRDATEELSTWIQDAGERIGENNVLPENMKITEIAARLARHREYFVENCCSEKLLDKLSDRGLQLENQLKKIGDQEQIEDVRKEVSFSKMRTENVLKEASKIENFLFFSMGEAELLEQIQHAEELLSAEEKDLKTQRDVADILAEHEKFFATGPFSETCITLMQDLSKWSQHLLDFNPLDNSSTNKLQQLKNNLEIVVKKSEDIRQRLTDLPGKWKIFNEKCQDLQNDLDENESLLHTASTLDPTHSVDVYRRAILDCLSLSKTMKMKSDLVSELSKYVAEIETSHGAAGGTSSEARSRLERLSAACDELREDLNTSTPKYEEALKCLEVYEDASAKLADLQNQLVAIPEWTKQSSQMKLEECLQSLKSLKDNLHSNYSHYIQQFQVKRHQMNSNQILPASVRKLVDNVGNEIEKTWTESNHLLQQRIHKYEDLLNIWRDWDTVHTTLQNRKVELEKLKLTDCDISIEKKLASIHVLLERCKELQRALPQLESLSAQFVSDYPEVCDQIGVREKVKLMKDDIEDICQSLNRSEEQLMAAADNWQSHNQEVADLERRMEELSESVKSRESIDHIQELTKQLQSFQPNLQSAETTNKNLESGDNHSEYSALLQSKLLNLRRCYDDNVKLLTENKENAAMVLDKISLLEKTTQQLHQFIKNAENELHSQVKPFNSLEELILVHDMVQKLSTQAVDQERDFSETKAELSSILADNQEVSETLRRISHQWQEFRQNLREKTDQIVRVKEDWISFNDEVKEILEDVEECQLRLHQVESLPKLEMRLSAVKSNENQILLDQDKLHHEREIEKDLLPQLSATGQSQITAQQEAATNAVTTCQQVMHQKLVTLEESLLEIEQLNKMMRDLSVWLTKLRTKLMHRIYRDEITQSGAQFEQLQSELVEKHRVIEEIDTRSAQLTEKCPSLELNEIATRKQSIISSYTEEKQMVEQCLQVCQAWRRVDDLKMSYRSVVEDSDIQELCYEEANHLEVAILPLYEEARTLLSSSAPIDVIMKNRDLSILQRKTNLPVSLQSETEKLVSDQEELLASLKSKKSLLTSLESDSSKFENLLTELSTGLGSVKFDLSRITLQSLSAESIQNAREAVNLSLQHFSELKRLHDEVCQLGADLTSKDPNKRYGRDQKISQMKSLWSQLDQLANDKKQQVDESEQIHSQLETLLQSNRQSILELKEQVSQMRQHDVTTPESVSIALNIQESVHKQLMKRQSSNRLALTECLQRLIKCGRHFSDFDRSKAETTVESVLSEWDELTHRSNQWLDLLNDWKLSTLEVRELSEELHSWLDDNLKAFRTGAEANAHLTIYQSQQPYYSNLFHSLSSKISAIVKVLREHDCSPTTEDKFTSIPPELQRKFAQLEELAASVSGNIDALRRQSDCCKEKMKQLMEKVGEMKHQLQSLDKSTNLSDIHQLLHNLPALNRLAVVIEEEIVGEASSLQDQLGSVSVHKSDSLPHEWQFVEKKIAALRNYGDKIRDSFTAAVQNLYSLLEGNVGKWLADAAEKLAQIEDIPNDLSNIKENLASLEDIESGLPQAKSFDQELQTVSEAVRALSIDVPGGVDTVDSTLPDLKRVELKVSTLKRSLAEISSHLEELDSNKVNFVAVIKSTELSAKHARKFDKSLEDKKEKVKLNQQLLEKLKSQKPKLHEIKEKSQIISKFLSSNEEMMDQYRDIEMKYEESIDKLGQLIIESQSIVKDHVKLEEELNAFRLWLDAAESSLLEMQQADSNAHSKMESMKQLLNCVDNDGQSHQLTAQQLADKICSNTAPTGRDAIQKELGALTLRFEVYRDELNDIKEQVDMLLNTQTSLDANVANFKNWITQIELQVNQDRALPLSDLQDKMSRLQTCKGRLREINNKYNIFENLARRADQLPNSKEFEEPIRQLKNRLTTVLEGARLNVMWCQSMVEEHQAFADSLQACQDWLQITEASPCLSDYSCVTERPLIESQLDQLNSLRDNLRDQGEGQELEDNLETALSVLITSPADNKISPDVSLSVDNVKRRMKSLRSKCDSAIDSLNRKFSLMEEFDENLNALKEWIKSSEAQLEDCTWKDSLDEKKQQLIFLGDLQKDCQKHEVYLEALHKIVDATPSDSGKDKLHQKVTQLSRRFHKLDESISSAVKNWVNYVEHHQQMENLVQLGEQQLAQIDSDMRNHIQRSSGVTSPEESATKIRTLREQIRQSAKQMEDISIDCLQPLEEIAQKVIMTSGPLGREEIPRRISDLRVKWESLMDRCRADERNKENKLKLFETVEENSQQLAAWLISTELRMDKLKLTGFLEYNFQHPPEEYKAKLLSLKTLHLEIRGKARPFHHLEDRFTQLDERHTASQLCGIVENICCRYKALCDSARDHSGKLESAYEQSYLAHESRSQFENWYESVQDQLEATRVTSRADKLTLQMILWRLGELTESEIPIGRERLANVSEALIANQSDQKESLLKELRERLNQLEQEIIDAKNSISAALTVKERIETGEEEIEKKLKELESLLKLCSNETKRNATEKKEMRDKLENQRDEMKKLTPQLDNFYSSSESFKDDPRLQHNLSELRRHYTLLTGQLRDQIQRCTRIYEDHSRLEEVVEEVEKSLTDVETQMEATVDPSSGENIDRWNRDLELVDKQIHSTIEPLLKSVLVATSTQGREEMNIRFDNLVARFNNLKRQIDSQSIFNVKSISEFAELVGKIEQVAQWLEKCDRVTNDSLILKSDYSCSSVDGLLREGKTFEGSLRLIQGELPTYQRYFESIKTKSVALETKGVKYSPENEDCLKWYHSGESRLLTTKSTIMSRLQLAEELATSVNLFQETSRVLSNWLTNQMASLTTYVHNDRFSVRDRLEEAKKMSQNLDEGEILLNRMKEHGAHILSKVASQQIIRDEIEEKQRKYDDLLVRLKDSQDNLASEVDKLNARDLSREELFRWIREKEQEIREFTVLRDSLEEKRDQDHKCRMLSKQIHTKSEEMEEYNEQSRRMSDGGKISPQNEQLISRYKSLLSATKELSARCSEQVAKHEDYLLALSTCENWLRDAQKKKQLVKKSLSAQPDELKRAKEVLKELGDMKDEGFNLLCKATNLCESLYSGTSTAGQEVLREEVNSLRHDWEGIFSDIHDRSQNLGSLIDQLEYLREQSDQLDQWLLEKEQQCQSFAIWADNLEDKKLMKQNLTHILYELQLKETSLSSLQEKSDSIRSIQERSGIVHSISDMSSRLQNLLMRVNLNLTRTEEAIKEHQQYSEHQRSMTEWLRTLEQRLTSCGDASGDKHTLQNRLDRLKDVNTIRIEGERRLMRLENLADQTVTHTGPVGQSSIIEEKEKIKTNWKEIFRDLEKANSHLQSSIREWDEFDSLYNECAEVLKSAEHAIRELEPKSTLTEKETQSEKIERQVQNLTNVERAFDQLNDQAKRLSGPDGSPTRQAVQLFNRQQVLLHHAKDLHRRSLQNSELHKDYEILLEEFKSWLEHFEKRLERCINVSDCLSDDSKTSCLTERSDFCSDVVIAELMTDREIGFAKLQSLAEKMQTILPSTSATGREQLRNCLTGLQKHWDDLLTRLNEMKILMDQAIAQWSIYDESLEQFEKWLDEKERTMQQERGVESTLFEKKARLDRLKNLQLSIKAHSCVVQNILDKRPASLQKSDSVDSNNDERLNLLMRRYNSVKKRIDNLVDKKLVSIKSHQEYKDVCTTLRDHLQRLRIDLEEVTDENHIDRKSGDAKLLLLDKMESEKSPLNKKLQSILEQSEFIIETTSASGSQVVQDELDLMNNEFRDIFTVVESQRHSLQQLKINSDRYFEKVDAFIKWLSKTETAVSHSSSHLDTLDQKMCRLNQLEALNSDIASHQVELDRITELAAVTFQHGVSPHKANSVPELRQRYHSLVSALLSALKQCQDVFNTHEDFIKHLSSTHQWIHKASFQIDVDVGNIQTKEMVHQHLARIETFKRDLEVGQGMMKNAVHLAEQCKISTGSEGRENIRMELNNLSDKWDTLMRQYSEARSSLEGSLVELEEMHFSICQAEEWLNGMEARIKETKAQADFNEKITQAHRIKSLLVELKSHQPVIEAVIEKLNARRTPDSDSEMSASQLWSRYNYLLDSSSEFLSDCQTEIDQYHTYQKALSTFHTWLRDQSEAFTDCVGIYTRSLIDDAPTLANKTAKLKSLKSQARDSTSLDDLEAQTKSVLKSASSGGRQKLQNDLDDARSALHDYQNQLDKELHSLESYGDDLEEYKTVNEGFHIFLNESERELQNFLTFQPNLKAKADILCKFKKHHDQILQKKHKLDSLTQKGQKLIESHADSTLSFNLTKTAMRYQSLVSRSNEILTNLQAQHSDHARLQEACFEFHKWFALSDEKFRSMNLAEQSSRNSERSSKIRGIAELESHLETGKENRRLVHEFAQRVLDNTSADGHAAVEKEVNSIDADMERIMRDVDSLKTKLSTESDLYQQVIRTRDHLLSWLMEIERRVAEDGDVSQYTEFAALKTGFERFKLVLGDLESKKIVIDTHVQKCRDYHDPILLDSAQDIFRRHQKLSNILHEIVQRLEKIITVEENYREMLFETQEWLRSIDQKLSRMKEPALTRRELKARLDSLKVLISGDLKSSTNKVAKLSKSLEQGENIPVAALSGISGEIRDLEREQSSLMKQALDIQDQLQTVFDTWQDYQNLSKRTSDWINSIEIRLLKPDSNKDELDGQENNFSIYKMTFDEIQSHRNDIKTLKESADSIHRFNFNSELPKQTADFESRINRLMLNCQESMMRLETVLHHQKDFELAFSQAHDWMSQTKSDLLNCAEAGDKSTALQKLATIRELNNQMITRGRSFLDQAMDCGEQLLHSDPHNHGADDTNITQIRTKLNSLKRDWQDLTSHLSESLTNMENTSMRWSLYDETRNRLSAWLDETELKMSRIRHSSDDFAHRKLSLEKLKTVKSEAELMDEEFKSFYEISDQLQNSSRIPSIMDEAFTLQSRFDLTKSKIKDLASSLSSKNDTYENYQVMLHSVEKALLAISFKLISANSSHCASMESAMQQIDQLTVLQSELEAQHSPLQKVIQSGESLMKEEESGGHQGTHKQSIRTQLEHITDSYNNLLSSASQLKDRLDNLVSKCHQFSDVMSQSERFILGELSNWWTQKIRHPGTKNLDDCLQEIDQTKKMQTKLLDHKQNVANAAHQCQMTTCFSFDPPASPTLFSRRQDNSSSSNESSKIGQSLDSQLSDQAAKLLREFGSQSENLENRLSSLYESRTGWEAANKLNQELSDWLASKRDFIDHISQKPTVLDKDASEADMLNLEKVQQEIKAELPRIVNLKEQYLQLSCCSQHSDFSQPSKLPSSFNLPRKLDAKVSGLQAQYDSLLRTANKELQKRQENWQVTTEYADKRDEIVEDMEITEKRANMLGSGRSRDEMDQLEKSGDSLPQNGEAPWIRNSGGNRGISKHFWPYNDGYKSRSSNRDNSKSPTSGRESISSPVRNHGSLTRSFNGDNNLASCRSEMTQTQTPRNDKKCRTDALKKLVTIVHQINDDLTKIETLNESADSKLHSHRPSSATDRKRFRHTTYNEIERPSTTQSTGRLHGSYQTYGTVGVPSRQFCQSPRQYRFSQNRAERDKPSVDKSMSLSASDMPRNLDEYSIENLEDEFILAAGAPPSYQHSARIPPPQSPTKSHRSVSFIGNMDKVGQGQPDHSRGIFNHYGLDRSTFSQYIPTRPHWQTVNVGGSCSNIPSLTAPSVPGHQSARYQPTEGSAGASIPVVKNLLVKEFVCEYRDTSQRKSCNGSFRRMDYNM